MKQLILNVATYDFNAYAADRFVLFEDTILSTGDMAELDATLNELGLTMGECTVTDGKGDLLLPGLVAGHTHLYSTFARGWVTPFDPSSFQDVLDQLWWKLDHSLGRAEVYLSGLAGAGEFLKNGVTTIIDHHASGQVIKGSLNALKQGVVDEGGLRALFCFETSDRFDVDECVEENVSFYESQKEAGQGKCAGMIGMHASSSLSDATLKKIADSSGTMPIHAHVAESLEDVDRTYERCGTTIVERFDGFGLLRDKSLIAHGVHMADKEFALLKERGCSMVFNPTSNMNNGVGLPPVAKAVEHDLPWLVGNDGLGFNMNRDYQNLLFTHQLVHGPGSFNWDWLLSAINQGYDYVNDLLGCRIGRIEKGFDADFFVLPYTSITPVNADNIFGHFFFGLLDNLSPALLWSGGQLRIQDGMLKDEAAYRHSEAKQVADRLWQDILKG